MGLAAAVVACQNIDQRIRRPNTRTRTKIREHLVSPVPRNIHGAATPSGYDLLEVGQDIGHADVVQPVLETDESLRVVPCRNARLQELPVEADGFGNLLRN